MGYDLESAACVVRVEAFPEIRGAAVVEAIRFGDGAEDVGVIHFAWGMGQPSAFSMEPYFAESVLLRQGYGGQDEGHSSLPMASFNGLPFVVSCKEAKNGGGLRTPFDDAVFFVFLGIGASQGFAGVAQ